VNPGPADDWVNHWGATVGVAPDGSVRIAYHQRREAEQVAADGSTFSRRVDTIYQESDDGGQIFSKPLRVNRVDGDLGFAAASGESEAGSHPEPFLGDYFQLAVAGRVTYIARTEAVRVKVSEPARYPPIFHHQRLWVAVVRSG
jgi:hypothetical protein